MTTPVSDAAGAPVPSLFTVLDLLRRNRVMTRPELAVVSGLGRKVVTQRVDDLIRSGLVIECQIAPSQGGRPPSQVAFRPDAGFVLDAELGSTALSAGIADLAGSVLTHRPDTKHDVLGAEIALTRIEAL